MAALVRRYLGFFVSMFDLAEAWVTVADPNQFATFLSRLLMRVKHLPAHLKNTPEVPPPTVTMPAARSYVRTPKLSGSSLTARTPKRTQRQTKQLRKRDSGSASAPTLAQQARLRQTPHTGTDQLLGQDHSRSAAALGQDGLRSSPAGFTAAGAAAQATLLRPTSRGHVASSPALGAGLQRDALTAPAGPPPLFSQGGSRPSTPAVAGVADPSPVHGAVPAGDDGEQHQPGAGSAPSFKEWTVSGSDAPAGTKANPSDFHGSASAMTDSLRVAMLGRSTASPAPVPLAALVLDGPLTVAAKPFNPRHGTQSASPATPHTPSWAMDTSPSDPRYKVGAASAARCNINAQPSRRPSQEPRQPQAPTVEVATPGGNDKELVPDLSEQFISGPGRQSVRACVMTCVLRRSPIHELPVPSDRRHCPHR